MLEKAIEIALKAHTGQKDKSGKPYIEHILRVMHAGRTEDEKICGVLHDLIEDTDWTLEDLEKKGFGKHIIDAIQCLTKQKNENYDRFIDRVMTNKLALQVKINDLHDNLNIKRLDKITENDVDRLNKYLKAYKRIQTCLNA